MDMLFQETPDWYTGILIDGPFDGKWFVQINCTWWMKDETNDGVFEVVLRESEERLSKNTSTNDKPARADMQLVDCSHIYVEALGYRLIVGPEPESLVTAEHQSAWALMHGRNRSDVDVEPLRGGFIGSPEPEPLVTAEHQPAWALVHGLNLSEVDVELSRGGRIRRPEP
jgi:hypothetical protein